MKRSKIFLGLTAGLLATVAFVSAKAKFTSIPVCYFRNGVAVADPNQSAAQTIANGAQLFTVIAGVRYLLYTFIGFTSGCVDPVYAVPCFGSRLFSDTYLSSWPYIALAARKLYGPGENNPTRT